MAKPKVERRKQPRVRGAAGLRLGSAPHAAGLQVKDISLSGLSFRISRPIEFMTRLMMTLILPIQSDPAGQPETPTSVPCEGAVVRCEPVHGSDVDQYEVAVFFTHLDDTAREAVEEYVKAHL
jgi:hypothetical protein